MGAHSLKAGSIFEAGTDTGESPAKAALILSGIRGAQRLLSVPDCH